MPVEGRPETELVFRTASEVGNYDYLIDYRFKQDGAMYIKIGATGLDGVKGVAATSMDDPTAADDTRYGTLIAPHLVASNHDHYFNFRLDFDVDQPVNRFSTMDIVPSDVPDDSPRRSMWRVAHTCRNRSWRRAIGSAPWRHGISTSPTWRGGDRSAIIRAG